MIRSILFLVFATTFSFAQTTPEVLTIKENGLRGRFEVSRTEAQRIRKTDGMPEVVRFAARASAKAAAGHLKALERASGEKHDLVLYESGKPQTVENRRVVTRQVIVTLRPGADLASLKTAVNALAVSQPSFAPGHAIFDFDSGEAALAGALLLETLPGVVEAHACLAKQSFARFVPNDPRYAFNETTNTVYQWHLKNTGANDGTAGEDAGGLETVWDTFRGNGITISIVDDGLQIDHPDLLANTGNALHRDWNDNTPLDPRGRQAKDNHGTNCAGVAAGVGNNGIGITGAAMNASLVGLRLITVAVGDVAEAEAMAWRTDVIHISNNSWGPTDDGKNIGGPGVLARGALEQGVNTGRGGRGVIYMWAAGNGHDKGDRSTYDGWNNSPFTLSVGAVDDQGGMTWYSEHGPNLVISAPSNGANRQAITTTNNVGYTDNFGGTSSATPLASGVVALMLQANPNLGWRDVQEILIRTARKNSPGDAEWVVNGAGFNFNHKWGAGAINAQAAVTMAQTWTNLGTRRSHIVAQNAIATAIPDNNATGITRTFDLSAAEQMRLEHVLLAVNITHPRRGDLDIRLTAPSGVSDIFFVPHNDVNPDLALAFPLLSVRHWGENMQGTWTVTVSDRTAANAGTLNDVQLEFYGTRAAPLAVTPVVTSPATVSGTQNSPFAYQITANNNPASYSATGLPAWLTLNATTGLISGTPTANGTFNFTVTATNTAGSGNLAVTLDTFEPAARTFPQFRALYMTPQQQEDPEYMDMEDDPDDDGISNVLEFAFGGTPVGGNRDILPRLASSSGTQYFEYQVDTLAAGIRVTPQVSGTLAPGSWTDVVPVFHQQAGSIQTWRVAVPSGPSNRFYRVEISDLAAPR
ncbi:MAG: S8 family serine peptidase [Verrucomicrobiaceae bacterium]|nr:S8 family serine peptidase [Verrucomicrobiaceae bacterium]